MKISLLGKDINNDTIRNRLTENDFDNKFSLKQKVYYNLVRPLLPLSLRQKLQEKYNSNIKFKENFIDDSLLNYLRENENWVELLEKITYPNNNSCAIISTHDVEDEEGFNFIPKLIELEEKFGIKSSWNIVPYKYKIDEGIIRLIKESGHEIGIHGYNHDGKLYYSEKIFNERATYINEALKKYEAVGFRSPMVHRNLKWLQKLNIKYDASCFDYDPFQPFPGGTGSIWPFVIGKFVELPYTMPQDHTIFYVLKEKEITIWKNKAKWISENKGIILLLTHPDYLIDKFNFSKYVELLEYLKTIQNAFYCLPKDFVDIIRSWNS